MGIPEQPQSGMDIAPDGMVYEILEDGTIKRIGKVSPDGKFEPFGGTKDGIREKDGIIYRVINGKERKIGRILPNGEIETINQRIKIEAEVSRNKVKAATIVSVCSLLAFFVALYAMQQVWKTREYDNKVKPVYSRYLDEVTPTSESLDGYINQLDKLIKLKEVKYTENKRKIAEIINEIKAKQAREERKAKEAEEARKAEQAKAEQAKADEEERKAKEAETKKAEEKRKRQEAETKKAEGKKEKSGGGTRIGSLYWSKRSAKEMNWGAAVKYCKDLDEGGYTDWRLPNIDELRTLIQNHSGTQSGGSCPISKKAGKLAWSDRTGDCNGISGSNFSKLGDTYWFWSSSTRSDYSSVAWRVDFGDGYVGSNYKISDSYVRCVR